MPEVATIYRVTILIERTALSPQLSTHSLAQSLELKFRKKECPELQVYNARLPRHNSSHDPTHPYQRQDSHKDLHTSVRPRFRAEIDFRKSTVPQSEENLEEQRDPWVETKGLQIRSHPH